MAEYIVDVGNADEEYKAYFCRMAEQLMGNPIREKIVRCRECRRFHPRESSILSCHFELDNGLVQWRYAEPDGFCKWGELRDDA